MTLIVDRLSEVFDLLPDCASRSFYDFAQARTEPGCTYIVGRQNLLDNMAKFRLMAESGLYNMIFCNAAEGSWTLESQIKQLKLDDLVRSRQVLLIGGAQVDEALPCLALEHFLLRILDYPENLEAQHHTCEIFEKKNKPYDFLFLNGRARPHRKYLYERMRRRGLLERSLFTMLDARPTVVRHFDFRENGINVMATATPLVRLPDCYEVARYRDPQLGPIVEDRTFLKQDLFRREWGEIYLEPRPYIDTYFSLITETVCAESTLSFRTEKIAKPITMGHPFVVASTPGFYRDLRSIGFRTFDHVIDESFDTIDNAQQRLNRLIDVVDDLCRQDLDSFITACQDVCKYNQQHLEHLAAQTRQGFPQTLKKFLERYGRQNFPSISA